MNSGSVEQLRQYLTDADRIAWSQPGFPPQHRPDVDFLLPSIKVGPYPPLDQPLHPRIKPVVRRLLERQFAQHAVNRQMNESGLYIAKTREIYVQENELLYPETLLQGLMWHLAANDLSLRQEEIKPAGYYPELRYNIQSLLGEAFPTNFHPSSSKIKVYKSGFRRMLFVDDYFVSDIMGNHVLDLNQIYSTSHEMITGGIIACDGDLDRFNHVVRNGALVPQTHEAHIRFMGTLFQVMQYVDWPDILTAFETGDVELTQTILKYKAHKPNLGTRLYSALVRSII